METIVLVDGDRVLTRSDAVLRILDSITGPWRLARIAKLVPRRLRDLVYAHIAQRRYRWFGRRKSCMIPPPEVAERFLRDEE